MRHVSTPGQTLEAQLAQLTAAGAGQGVAGADGRARGVFRETASGAARERPQLARLLASLSPGDVVLVTRLDRLARSTRDLLNVLATIADKSAAFRSLGDPWADTTTPHGRLMLTVLAGLAEFERELIRARAAPAPRPRGARWASPASSPPTSSARPGPGARRARPSPASPGATNVHHATIGRL